MPGSFLKKILGFSVYYIYICNSFQASSLNMQEVFEELRTAVNSLPRELRERYYRLMPVVPYRQQQQQQQQPSASTSSSSVPRVLPPWMIRDPPTTPGPSMTPDNSRGQQHQGVSEEVFNGRLTRLVEQVHRQQQRRTRAVEHLREQLGIAQRRWRLEQGRRQQEQQEDQQGSEQQSPQQQQQQPPQQPQTPRRLRLPRRPLSTTQRLDIQRRQRRLFNSTVMDQDVEDDEEEEDEDVFAFPRRRVLRDTTAHDVSSF